MRSLHARLVVVPLAEEEDSTFGTSPLVDGTTSPDEPVQSCVPLDSDPPTRRPVHQLKICFRPVSAHITRGYASCFPLRRTQQDASDHKQFKELNVLSTSHGNALPLLGELVYMQLAVGTTLTVEVENTIPLPR